MGDAREAIQVDVVTVGKDLRQASVQIQSVIGGLGACPRKGVHGLGEAVAESIILEVDDRRQTADGDEAVGGIVGVGNDEYRMLNDEWERLRGGDQRRLWGSLPCVDSFAPLRFLLRVGRFLASWLDFLLDKSSMNKRPQPDRKTVCQEYRHCYRDVNSTNDRHCFRKNNL